MSFKVSLHKVNDSQVNF